MQKKYGCNNGETLHLEARLISLATNILELINRNDEKQSLRIAQSIPRKTVKDPSSRGSLEKDHG